ncbi:hypothetical protein ACVWZ4_001302 [Bradyrhizobium sp. USDA 4472]
MSVSPCEGGLFDKIAGHRPFLVEPFPHGLVQLLYTDGVDAVWPAPNIVNG